jgi:hypothetical protein
MANNFTESSSFLAIKEDQIPLVQDIIDRVTAEIVADEDESGGYLGCTVDVQPNGVYFGGEESCNVDQVAQIAKKIVEDLKIDEPFFCSWAYTCSKPRVDEFGGGAFVVRRGNDTQWIDAMSYVMELPYIKPPTVVEHTEEST